MNVVKKNKGITLISLIVTIIVLLILAGVTISQITGSENAMEKATEAREKDKQGTELEAIKLAVVNSVANGFTGLVDTDSLKSGLVGLIQENPEEIIVGNGPWVVTSPSGLIYEINQNANVSKLEPLSISSNLAITENKVKSLTVKKYGSAKGKQVSWSKEGNITFVTDETGNTTIDNPTTDTIYIKAGAYDDGTTGKVTISANGEENQECNITIAEREWSKIGESVTYTSKYEADVQKTNPNFKIGWRLFYRDEQDNGYTYIISDKLSSEYEPVVNSENTGLYNPSRYYRNYTSTNLSSSKNVAKTMNPLLANSDSTKGLFEANPLYESMKALAWLSDTEYWKDFTRNGTDASQEGEYAIGCSSLELLIKSYNRAWEDDKSRQKMDEATLGSYGYSFSTDNILNPNYNNGIYSGYWWLNSPLSSSSGSSIIVSGTALGSKQSSTTYSLAVRPLVAIPNSNFDFATLTVK